IATTANTMGGKAEKNTYLGKIVTEAVVRYTASVFYGEDVVGAAEVADISPPLFRFCFQSRRQRRMRFP
ncbi:MAG: hypothetical protein ACTTGX_04255, partial [Candidatus Cryptobacteroides sp.]